MPQKLVEAPGCYRNRIASGPAQDRPAAAALCIRAEIEQTNNTIPRGDGSRPGHMVSGLSFRARACISHPIILEISMLSIFRKLMTNDDGATAIEYVLIASLISVAAITAMGHVGGKVSNVLSNVANAMT